MSQIIPPGDWAIETLALPAAEPMTLATAKLQCRVPTAITEYDALLSDAISAARNYIESTFAIYLAKQRVRITFASFPQGDRFRLPVWPIQTIDAMDYVTADGVAHFLNVGEVDTVPVPDVIARLWRKPAEMVLPFAHIWPPATLQIGGAIRISATVGFITGSPELLPMPAAALQAMKLLIGHAYMNGSAVTIGSLQKSDPLALGVRDMMANLRLWA